MAYADKYNKSARLFDFDVKDLTFRSLKDLYNNNGSEHPYLVKAMWINNKGKFGENPTVATPGFLVGLPSHMTDTVKEMLHDPELVSLVNAGKIGFKVYCYESNNRTCYNVTWIDM